MKIQVKGQTMPLKNLDTARLRDVYELQQQTGWKLNEIREQANEGSTVTTAMLVFLSANAAGVPMTWDEVLDLTFTDVVVVREPGDVARGKKADADPQKPSGDSSPDAADPAEGVPAED